MAIRSVPAIKVAPVHRGNTRAPDDRSTEPDAGAEHQDRMDGEPAAEALSDGLPVAGPRAMSAYTTVVGEVHEGVRVRDVVDRIDGRFRQGPPPGMPGRRLDRGCRSAGRRQACLAVVLAVLGAVAGSGSSAIQAQA
jgi:hypothetical protein